MPSILILTQYYPPETGAPQNRLSSLAVHLKNMGWQVSVLTAMPNYPQMRVHDSYKGKLYVKENVDDITVHRTWLYVSESKRFVRRLINYFSFVFTALLAGLFKVKKHDIILCESPPLFLGITARLLKSLKGSKLVFNVSDLWPETAVQLGIIKNKRIIAITERLERYIYRHADMVSGQTLGIVSSIRARMPDKHVVLLRNGIDSAKFGRYIINEHLRVQYGYSETDFIVLYGGVLGYAQNLEVILKAAKSLKEERDIKFLIVGDGPNKENLLEWKETLGLDNVTFAGPRPAEEMPSFINASNVGVVPLRNLPLFKGAIPSKIFEYLLLRRPILLGVDGEARDLFIEEAPCGVYFTPQDDKELVAGILKLRNDRKLAETLGATGREYVLNSFERSAIASAFEKELRKLLN